MKKPVSFAVIAAAVAAFFAQSANAERNRDASRFLEIGPSLLYHQSKGESASQYGAEVTASYYFMESDTSALRLSSAIGFYSGEIVNSYYNRDRYADTFKGTSTTVLVALEYEIENNNMRFRAGPMLGLMGVNWEGKYYKSETMTGSSPAYGLQASVTFDLESGRYVTLQYKYLDFSDVVLKENTAHAATISLGFSF